METTKNAAKGKLFQNQIQKWFSLNRNEKFNMEVAMPIGFPAKLSKDIIWQYQNEWRLVGYDKMMEVDGSYNCKFFKISKVYLGNKMDAAARKELISICKEKGIPYAGVQTVNDRYVMQDCPYPCENCPNRPSFKILK